MASAIATSTPSADQEPLLCKYCFKQFDPAANQPQACLHHNGNTVELRDYFVSLCYPGQKVANTLDGLENCPEAFSWVCCHYRYPFSKGCIPGYHVAASPGEVVDGTPSIAPYTAEGQTKRKGPPAWVKKPAAKKRESTVAPLPTAGPSLHTPASLAAAARGTASFTASAPFLGPAPAPAASFSGAGSIPGVASLTVAAPPNFTASSAIKIVQPGPAHVAQAKSQGRRKAPRAKASQVKAPQAKVAKTLHPPCSTCNMYRENLAFLPTDDDFYPGPAGTCVYCRMKRIEDMEMASVDEDD